jgi:hypothetical protein
MGLSDAKVMAMNEDPDPLRCDCVFMLEDDYWDDGCRCVERATGEDGLCDGCRPHCKQKSESLEITWLRWSELMREYKAMEIRRGDGEPAERTKADTQTRGGVGVLRAGL